MKATIDEVGNLIITPETPLEGYALEKWTNDYIKSGYKEPPLCVEQYNKKD